MPTDRRFLLALAALPLLAGCEQGMFEGSRPASTFGEANRQTMMAQVIDPDPQYEYLEPETSGARAAKAIERYRNDAVKKPDKVRASSGAGGGSSGT